MFKLQRPKFSWLSRIRARKPKLTFECDWVLGHGGFLLPDPTQVSHVTLAKAFRGKRTRVSVTILGDREQNRSPDWVKPAEPTNG